MVIHFVIPVNRVTTSPTRRHIQIEKFYIRWRLDAIVTNAAESEITLAIFLIIILTRAEREIWGRPINGLTLLVRIIAMRSKSGGPHIKDERKISIKYGRVMQW
jgi:hypothetical protein